MKIGRGSRERARAAELISLFPFRTVLHAETRIPAEKPQATLKDASDRGLKLLDVLPRVYPRVL
jgi:hypothetical protein